MLVMDGSEWHLLMLKNLTKYTEIMQELRQVLQDLVSHGHGVSARRLSLIQHLACSCPLHLASACATPTHTCSRIAPPDSCGSGPALGTGSPFHISPVVIATSTG